MHDLPRQKLSELLAQYGFSLCDDAKKLEGLLKDALFNKHERETIVLVGAVREGVPRELRGSTSGKPPAALVAKLVRKLCDKLGLKDAEARWSVESWAIALGVPIPQMPPNSGIDLAEIARQHRAKAQQAKAKLAQDQAHARQVQKESKELAETTGDFETAIRMIKAIDVQWRDAKLYEKLCRGRDRAKKLDAFIHDAVLKGQLEYLRGSVQELLTLQPNRDDMRRLLDELPEAPNEFTNSIGMKFKLIRPGEFVMGSNEADDEKPPHRVRITQSYYLGVFEVTQAQYQAVTGQNPSHFSGNPRLPVEQVSWNDAVAYVQKLSKLSAELSSGWTYRLPTEAEWEYACRAGATGKWSFGDQKSRLAEYAWFDGNSGNQTHPVGKKIPNAWGLHDMHGNVWEWCQDWYDANFYAKRLESDPPGPTSGQYRVMRGGSWDGSPGFTRSAVRDGYTPEVRNDLTGFRVVCVSRPRK